LLSRLDLLEQMRTKAYLKEVRKHFNYEKFQPKIAGFFMQHANRLGLSTCFYCDIDHINAFDNIGDYFNVIDLLNRGDEEDLMTINGIGESTAKIIISSRNPHPIRFISSLNVDNGVKRVLEEKQREMIKAGPDGVDTNKKARKRMRNHFTLDHIIPKGKFPLFALSLYNFVPCCYSCNSKFKKTSTLFETAAPNYLSPSSSAFAFDKQVHFTLLFQRGGWSDVLKEQDMALHLECLQNPDVYRKYIRLFKLSQRYVAHKSEVVALIDKRRRYSDTRLQEIANIAGVPVDKVKADIFGEELFSDDARWLPLTKLKRDIAWDIGIPGVAGRKDDKQYPEK
jgi:hypothetical protein